MRKSGGYRWVKVRLEEEVIEEIKARGFALTEFVELATLLALHVPELASRRDYIRAFLDKISIDSTQKNNWSPGRGLNPRPAAYQAAAPPG